MDYVRLSAEVAVGDPPSSANDVQQLAGSDFRSILNLGPIEESGEYTSREEAIAARSAGLSYLCFPLNDDQLRPFYVEGFRTKLKMLPAPTYVHGAKGGSTVAALALIDHARSQSWSPDRTVRFANELGLHCTDGQWESLVNAHLNEV